MRVRTWRLTGQPPRASSPEWIGAEVASSSGAAEVAALAEAAEAAEVVAVAVVTVPARVALRRDGVVSERKSDMVRQCRAVSRSRSGAAGKLSLAI